MSPAAAPAGSVLDVARAFLKLGCASFGGPIAHLGYFRHEFVLRRRWLDERAFAEIVALCQFLPGPTSSQVGFCLGLGRAGFGGALAAWAAFTLPSALIMFAVAQLSGRIAGTFAGALTHGLALAAVAIVLQAVLGMARAHCASRPHVLIALGAAALVLMQGSGAAQAGAIAMGALLGLLVRPDPAGGLADRAPAPAIGMRVGVAAAALFAMFLVASLAEAPRGGAAALFAACFRAGALVFGGGHVVLPLLREAVVAPGWVPPGEFLAGYGAAQALPGPLFSFAAFLGAIALGPAAPVAGAATALAGLFLPGLLLVLAILPLWAHLRSQGGARRAIGGANAAVVGVLAAALVHPIASSAIGGVEDLAIAALGTAWLGRGRAAPLLVVVFCTVGGLMSAAIGTT